MLGFLVVTPLASNRSVSLRPLEAAMKQTPDTHLKRAAHRLHTVETCYENTALSVSVVSTSSPKLKKPVNAKYTNSSK